MIKQDISNTTSQATVRRDDQAPSYLRPPICLGREVAVVRVLHPNLRYSIMINSGLLLRARAALLIRLLEKICATLPTSLPSDLYGIFLSKPLISLLGESDAHSNNIEHLILIQLPCLLHITCTPVSVISHKMLGFELPKMAMPLNYRLSTIVFVTTLTA